MVDGSGVSLPGRFATSRSTDLDENALGDLRLHGAALPETVRLALLRLRNQSGPPTLLLRGIPVGNVPRTPPDPLACVDGPAETRYFLALIGLFLGEPISYASEHSGVLVQNMVPVACQDPDGTISTSSARSLPLHTESPFHPFPPWFLLLLCLRGSRSAVTTLADAKEALTQIGVREHSVLSGARFSFAVDDSFTRSAPAGSPPIVDPVIRPAVVDLPAGTLLHYDADDQIMVPTDTEAQAARRKLGNALDRVARSVVLERGDLLCIDNRRCAHGRTSFFAPLDGTDRWIQRMYVVGDLEPSAQHRSGRSIRLGFGGETNHQLPQASSDGG